MYGVNTYATTQYGSTAIAPFVLVILNDTSVGSESHAILNGFTINQPGAGSEAIENTISLQLNDINASLIDTLNILFNIGIAETKTVSDIIALLVSIGVSQTATALDLLSINKENSIQLGETATATETVQPFIWVLDTDNGNIIDEIEIREKLISIFDGGELSDAVIAEIVGKIIKSGKPSVILGSKTNGVVVITKNREGVSLQSIDTKRTLTSK